MEAEFQLPFEEGEKSEGKQMLDLPALAIQIETFASMLDAFPQGDVPAGAAQLHESHYFELTDALTRYA